MALADMLPTLDDAALLTLKGNAARLAVGSVGVRHDQAITLLPLIEAEMTARAALKPQKAAPRPRRKKAGAG